MTSFVTVSELTRAFEEDKIMFSVGMDLLSLKETTPKLVVQAIADAISDYVVKNHAADMFTIMKPNIEDKITEAVNAAVEKRVIELVSKMDIEVLAKLACIGASKELGKKICS